MNHTQKYLLNSTTPIANQTLEQTKKFKFSNVRHRTGMNLKYLLRAIVNKTLYLKGICSSLRNKFNRRKITRLPKAGWAPLVKNTNVHTSEADTFSGYTYNKIRINCPTISNKYVLCVGGRGKLYPEYRCLIESLGGSLLVYRGNQKGDTDRLPGLLTCADMVICPVDCVNHETYFAVKHFCKKSGKPCALLDRCDLTTFGKGVEVLASTPT